MMANRSGLPGKGRREESRQCYAARQSETCCNDGIWGLEQPASGCMMEEALVETWLIDLIQCGNQQLDIELTHLMVIGSNAFRR